VNHAWRVKVDENAPHFVVDVVAIVIDVTDVVREEVAGQYRVYCYKESAVEGLVVECDMEIAHVSLVNDYSCKQHLHKEIAVLVDDVEVVADDVEVVADDDDAAVVVVVVVAAVEEEQIEDDVVAAVAEDDAVVVVAHKDE